MEHLYLIIILTLTANSPKTDEDRKADAEKHQKRGLIYFLNKSFSFSLTYDIIQDINCIRT